jgi:hypothetical protein
MCLERSGGVAACIRRHPRSDGPKRSCAYAGGIIRAVAPPARGGPAARARTIHIDNCGVAVLSEHTVRDHVKAVLTKTRVSSRAELVSHLFYEYSHAAGAEVVHV